MTAHELQTARIEITAVSARWWFWWRTQRPWPQPRFDRLHGRLEAAMGKMMERRNKGSR